MFQCYISPTSFVFSETRQTFTPLAMGGACSIGREEVHPEQKCELLSPFAYLAQKDLLRGPAGWCAGRMLEKFGADKNSMTHRYRHTPLYIACAKVRSMARASCRAAAWSLICMHVLTSVRLCCARAMRLAYPRSCV